MYQADNGSEALNLEELAEMIKEKGNSLKTEENRVIILSRMINTIKKYRYDMHHLHREIQEIRLSSTRGAGTETFDIYQLTEQERLDLFDAMLLRQHEVNEQEKRKQKRLTRSLQKQTNQLKYILIKLLEDDDIDPKTKENLKNLLKQAQ